MERQSIYLHEYNASYADIAKDFRRFEDSECDVASETEIKADMEILNMILRNDHMLW